MSISRDLSCEIPFLAVLDQKQVNNISRVISCRVNHENHHIYPMHSFKNDELCVDYSRNHSKIRSYSI